MGVRSYSNYVIIMAGMGGGAFSIHLNGASMNPDGLEAVMQFESGVAKMAVEMASFFSGLCLLLFPRRRRRRRLRHRGRRRRFIPLFG